MLIVWCPGEDRAVAPEQSDRAPRLLALLVVRTGQPRQVDQGNQHLDAVRGVLQRQSNRQAKVASRRITLGAADEQPRVGQRTPEVLAVSQTRQPPLGLAPDVRYLAIRGQQQDVDGLTGPAAETFDQPPESRIAARVAAAVRRQPGFTAHEEDVEQAQLMSCLLLNRMRHALQALAGGDDACLPRRDG